MKSNNQQRPNILVIQADQLAAGFLSAYHNPIAVTPHIDSLASSGAVFDSAYCNFPLCAPSRFSMMSGQLASTIGAYDNGAEFPSSIPTFAHYLRALNYQTALVGKMHFVGADQLHGFEQRLTTDIYPADFGWTGDWSEAQSGHSNDKVTFTGAGVCLNNMQMAYDAEVCHRAERKLYDLASGTDERPFMLFTSITHPHDPYQCLQEHWDLYRHDDIDMPKVGTLPEEATDPYSKRLRTQYGLEDFEPSEEQIRVARHAYYGSVSYVDDMIGRLLAVLRKTGMDKNTIIVVTSDHGDMMGERGLWYKKSFFEASCKVPMIISGPGIEEKRIESNVSLVDLLPTLIDIAAEEHQASPLVEDIEGRSLWGLANGNDTQWDNTAYSENLAEGCKAPILMVKKNKLKYVTSGIDPEQLFDLATDPDELVNLAGNPDHLSEQQQLSQLATQKWDMPILNEQIKLSQARRLFLKQTLQIGETANWDYAAPDQIVEHCLRGPTIYNQWAYGGSLGLHTPGNIEQD
ncbi:MAG: choline-sulfatase [Parasphingorhabdus sp.]